MTDKENDEMVKAYVDNMPDMVLNSNGIMNWRVFFNEVAKKVAGAAYKDGINAAQKQMMKEAVEAVIEEPECLVWRITADLEGDFVVKHNLRDGDKVKVLIIKEE